MLQLSDASKKELSQYSKNYLPILFNLYTAEDNEGEADKLAILETVRVYLSITDHKVSNLPSMLLHLPNRITREDKTKFVFLVIKKIASYSCTVNALDREGKDEFIDSKLAKKQKESCDKTLGSIIETRSNLGRSF